MKDWMTESKGLFIDKKGSFLEIDAKTVTGESKLENGNQNGRKKTPYIEA